MGNKTINTLIQILFRDRKTVEESVKFEKIDYEKLVKLASSHLTLPLLYIKLKNNKVIDKIPIELAKYLSEIYNLNSQRNKILKKEIKEIANIFDNNKINYVFVKGSALLICEYYKDLSERMIGDIDILTSKKDFKRSISLLKKQNYKVNNYKDYEFIKFRHYPRLVNHKRTFAVEIHHKLYDREDVNSNDFLSKKIKYNGIFVPSSKNILNHVILNFQINEQGFRKASYSLRSIYDYILTSNKHEINHQTNNKFIITFLLMLKNLRIKKNNRTDLNLLYKAYSIRIKLRLNIYFYYIIDTILNDMISNLEVKLKKIKLLLNNKKYFYYLISKK
jgi:hypothetical protein